MVIFTLIGTVRIFAQVPSNTGQGGNTWYGNTCGINIVPASNPDRGLFNTGVGESCLELNESGVGNSMFGRQAMRNAIGGSENSGIGYQSLFSLTTGSNNVAVGRSAGFSLQTGSFNTFVGPGFGGAGCGALIQNGNGNSFFGNVRTLDISNTIILADGGTTTTPGTQRLYIDNNGYTGLDLGNNIIPNNKLEINSLGAVTGTTGLRFRSFIGANNPVGNRFLTLNSNGDMVLASTSDNNWSLTGNANTTPSLLSGSPGSGYITSTNTSSFIGTTTNSDIVFRRNHLLSGAITPSNTIFGQLAVGLSNSTNTFSGADNAIFGSRAGFWMLSHNKNVIVGAEALSNLNADRNTAIGYKAGYNNYGGTPNGGMIGGEGNVYIGSEAGSPSNNIESNQLYIDNSSTLTPLIKGDFDSENLTFNVDANTDSRVTISSGVTGANGTSGLRLANLKFSNNAVANPSTTNPKVLSVNNDGDVILVNDATSQGITNVGCSGAADRTNYLTKNVDNNGNLTCSSVYENSWGWVGIGGTNNPQNSLEIVSTNMCETGLRFQNASRYCPIDYYPPMDYTQQYPVSLSVDGDGDVITQLDTSIYSTDGDIWPASTTNGLRRVGMDHANLHFQSDVDSDYGHIYIGKNVPTQTEFANAYTTGDYKLFVQGGILTEKVKVALRNPGTEWRDGVFANDYKLMPLKEVEAFVKENKHLPGIESADELVKNGLDLGDMQAKQMGKIEELTLHAIEQEKKLEAQAKEIEELKTLVKALLEKK